MHAKNSPVFFTKKGDEISSDREPKRSPRGPQNRGFRKPFGPQPPRSPPEDGKWTKNDYLFGKIVPKMHSKCVPHFANYGKIYTEPFAKRVLLLLELANSFRQRRGSKDKFDEAKDPKRGGR